MISERSGTGVAKLGWLCLVAGVIGAAAAVFLVLVEPAVPEDRYSYPLTAGGFTAIQVFFFVHHLGLVAGLYGLWHSGVVGTSRFGRWGAVGALVGMALLTLTELIAITGSDAPYPSPRTDMLDGLYGVSSVLIGVTLIMAGVAVVRTRVWRDWRRYVPLLLGVYVFVPMTPAVFGPFVLARFAIGGWMLGFALLGWALVETGEDAAVDLEGDELLAAAR
ncbi:MAG TPA: hypothetical protein VG929_00915 [Actinomycetota bacterium]|nr:hypothetical protein [Actinomycetota bacterium]